MALRIRDGATVRDQPARRVDPERPVPAGKDGGDSGRQTAPGNDRSRAEVHGLDGDGFEVVGGVGVVEGLGDGGDGVHDAAGNRGVIVNAPQPVSELLITNPPHTTGSCHPGRESNGER